MEPSCHTKNAHSTLKKKAHHVYTCLMKHAQIFMVNLVFRRADKEILS